VSHGSRSPPEEFKGPSSLAPSIAEPELAPREFTLTTILSCIVEDLFFPLSFGSSHRVTTSVEGKSFFAKPLTIPQGCQEKSVNLFLRGSLPLVAQQPLPFFFPFLGAEVRRIKYFPLCLCSTFTPPCLGISNLFLWSGCQKSWFSLSFTSVFPLFTTGVRELYREPRCSLSSVIFLSCEYPI